MNAVLRRYSTRLLTAALLGQGVLGLSRATAQDRHALPPYTQIPLDAPAAADTAKPLPADPSTPPPVVINPGPAAPAPTVVAEPVVYESVGVDWTKVPPVTPMPRPGW